MSKRKSRKEKEDVADVFILLSPIFMEARLDEAPPGLDATGKSSNQASLKEIDTVVKRNRSDRLRRHIM